MDRKKILIIFVGAWLSAAVLTWFLYAATKAPKVEKTVAIQAAARDLPAGTRLKKGDLKPVRVRENELPKGAIVDEQQAIDRPLLFLLVANEPLTTGKIGSSTGVEGLPSAIEIGKRAISVSITDTSGVAGLIQPRAHVDVLFTRPGSMAEAVTSTILEDVVVLAIGRNTEGINSSTPGQSATAPRPSSQSATLLVTPEQARKIELAKNQGKIGLALRNPLDHETAPGDSATTARALYEDFPMRKLPEPRRTPPPMPAPPVEKVVEVKEAPPPKRVVEVYRGDKHVQDTFQ